jgi:hypothetical protein
MLGKRIFPILGRTVTARSPSSVRTVLSCVIFVVSFSVGIHLLQIHPSLRPAGFSQPLIVKDSFYGEASPRSEGVKFVFFMGLEGSGHRRVGSLLLMSRSAHRINELGLREKVRDLQDALYSSAGLFYLHCNQAGYQSEIMADGPTPRRAPDTTSVPVENGGANETFYRVVNLFRNIADEFESGASINIPLNADGYIANQASYPQDSDSCRRRKHPDLALLYEACQAANVECVHAYLTTSAETILNAATPVASMKTKIARTMRLRNIFLYTTLLDVQLAQIAYFPDRTVACLDVSSDKGDPYDSNAPSQSWQRAIIQMFGLSTAAYSGAAISPTALEREDDTAETKSKRTVNLGSQGGKRDDDLYVEAFRESLHRTLDFCLANVRSVE